MCGVVGTKACVDSDVENEFAKLDPAQRNVRICKKINKKTPATQKHQKAALPLLRIRVNHATLALGLTFASRRSVQSKNYS